jgi:two-component system LytT family response regulator
MKRNMVKDDNFRYKSNSGYLQIKLDEIAYFKACGAYSSIIIGDREYPRLLCRNLNHLNRILKEHGFLRVHRSYLVNQAKVEYFNSKKLVIGIEGQEVPIAIRRKFLIIDRLLDFGLNDRIDIHRS